MCIKQVKHLALFCLIITLTLPLTAAQSKMPSWVSSKPSSLIYYTGVGMAHKTDKDFIKKAKSAALSDLISEIQVEVSSNSILNKQEINLKYSESFNQEIKTKANADIEQFELVESWSNNTEYWVYYQLDKLKYEEIMKERIETATRKGYDLWSKGLAQQRAGNIMNAADYFAKGIEIITPYINKDLTIKHEGRNCDIGNELYNSLNNIFNGISITCDKDKLELSHFDNDSKSVTISVKAKEIPVQGMKLKASFSSGAGTATIPSSTDTNGSTQLRISNITSKNQNQIIKIELDIAPLQTLSNSLLKDVVAKTISQLPATTISISSGKAPLKAIIYAEDGSNNQLLNAIAKEIAHNYFDIVWDESSANVKIFVETEYKIGVLVKGELYNMAETFCSGNITIFDINKNSVISSFGIDNIRSLSPEKDSVEKSRNTANREFLKKLRPVFSQKMSEINISPIEAKTTCDTLSEDDNLPNYDY